MTSHVVSLEQNTKTVENLMERFAGYTDGVRLLMLTQRNKDGGKSSNPDRYATKRISTNCEEFSRYLYELLELKSLAEEPMRIYSSVNRRNVEKGIRELKRRQLEMDYQDADSRRRFYNDIGNQWFSSLAKPGSRAETKFMFDIDSQEEYVRLLEDWAKAFDDSDSPKILHRYPTKKGWHILAEPFNPNLLAGYEIKKDGMVLIYF